MDDYHIIFCAECMAYRKVKIITVPFKDINGKTFPRIVKIVCPKCNTVHFWGGSGG